MYSMNYSREVAGFIVMLRIENGKPAFTCEALSGRTFETEEAVEKALQEYDRKLRKDFVNKQAFHRDYGGGLSLVEVTTLDGDQAWIKNEKGQRSKVNRHGLFPERSAWDAAEKEVTELREQIDSIMASVPRWQPQK